MSAPVNKENKGHAVFTVSSMLFILLAGVFAFVGNFLVAFVFSCVAMLFCSLKEE